MAAKKARKSKKAPSAKQLAQRRRFALAAKARSKAAKAKKRPARKAAKKRNASSRASSHQEVRTKELVAKGGRVYKYYFVSRGLSSLSLSSYPTRAEALKAGRAALKARKPNGKTIIKAKRVTVIQKNAKRAPRKPNITSASDLHLTGSAKPSTRDGVKGWIVAKKFYPGSASAKTVPLNKAKSALLDLKYGDVWKRRAKGNPKRKTKKRNARDYSPETPIEVTKHYRSGGPGYETKRQRVIRLGQRDLFAPEASIDELMGYLRKSNPSVITAVKRKMGAKAFAKASPSVLKRAMKSVLRAELAKRKPTKKASKKRVVTKGKRRNPSVEQKLQEWRGTPKDRDSVLNAPDGTPSPLYQLGPLLKMKLEGIGPKGFRIEKPGSVWVCADARGKIYFASKTNAPMTSLPAGPIAKVISLDYGPVHKTQFYDKAEEFTHEFGEENGKRPTLYSDGKGGLLLKGGDYYITYRGIQN